MRSGSGAASCDRMRSRTFGVVLLMSSAPRAAAAEGGTRGYQRRTHPEGGTKWQPSFLLSPPPLGWGGPLTQGWRPPTLRNLVALLPTLPEKKADAEWVNFSRLTKNKSRKGRRQGSTRSSGGNLVTSKGEGKTYSATDREHRSAKPYVDRQRYMYKRETVSNVGDLAFPNKQ